MHVVLRLERLVPVPIADTFAHRIRAIEELHEPHAALDEPSREYTVAREAGFQLIAVVHAIQFQCGCTLTFQVANLRRAELHLRGEFVAGDTSTQFAVARMTREMPVIQQL